MATVADANAAESGTSVPAPALHAQLVARLGPFIGLALVIVAFSLLTETPEQYLSLRNLRIVLAQTVIVALGAIGMIASIIGAWFVRGREGGKLSAQLHRGTNVAMILAAGGTFLGAQWLFGGIEGLEMRPWLLAFAIIAGLIAGWGIGFTSEYFTSSHYRPVKWLAGQAETGPATTIIGGVAQGMMSTAPSVVLVIGANGVIGRRLIEELIDQGWQVVGVSRRGGEPSSSSCRASDCSPESIPWERASVSATPRRRWSRRAT